MRVRVSWNLKKDMLEAMKEGDSERVFDVWATTIGFYSFLYKCGLSLLIPYVPHVIWLWRWRIPRSNYQFVALNRTLDGGKTAILRKGGWNFRNLEMKLDWLSCKLTTYVEGVVLQEQVLDLDN